MHNRSKIIIILISAICLSTIGLLLIKAYEKEKKDNEMIIASNKTHLEHKYYENSGELGIASNKGLLNNVYRTFNKISSQDRSNKLASSVLSDFYLLISKQEFEEAYGLLDKEYVEEFNINKNIFMARNENTGVTKYTITQISENKSDNIILVKYLVESENGYISKYMSIIKGKEGYSITLNGISEITKMSKQDSKDGVKSTITKRYKIGDRVAYKIQLENISDIDLKISMYQSGIYGLIQNNKYDHEIINTTQSFIEENYTIESGKSKTYVVMFNTSNYLEKIGVQFENGRIIEFDLANI